MRFRVIVEADAEREWQQAADWYEERESGVGLRFNAAVHQCLQSLAQEPERFPLISRLTRKARIHGWPYSIFFVINESRQQIKVVAVWHGKRNPARLRRRLN
jgi:plasmid stabilization system protein ParE